MVDVPTKSSLKTAAKSGGRTGLVSGLGKTAGRSVVGPGLGTALGGIVAASMLTGNDRDLVAFSAVDTAFDEMIGGGSTGGSSRGRM